MSNQLIESPMSQFQFKNRRTTKLQMKKLNHKTYKLLNLNRNLRVKYHQYLWMNTDFHLLLFLFKSIQHTLTVIHSFMTPMEISKLFINFMWFLQIISLKFEESTNCHQSISRYSRSALALENWIVNLREKKNHCQVKILYSPFQAMPSRIMEIKTLTFLTQKSLLFHSPSRKIN